MTNPVGGQRVAFWNPTTAQDEGLQGQGGGINAVLYAWSPSLLQTVILTVDASGNLSVTGGGGAGGGAVTVANGADVAEGATTDVAVTSDANGTISAKLRGLVKILASVWDSVNGRLKVDASGATVPVSGTFWQATQPISAASLPLPANAAQETGGNLATVATAQGAGATGVSQLAGGSGILGWLSGIFSKLSGTLTVSGAVTANAGTNLNTSALALEAGGNLAAIATNTTGAAKDSSLATIDSDLKTTLARNIAQVGGASLALGQSQMAAAVPVTIASDQISANDRVTRADNDMALVEERLVAWNGLTTRGQGRSDFSSRGSTFGRGVR